MSSNPFKDLERSLTGYCDALAESREKSKGGIEPDSPAAREAEADTLADEWSATPALDAALGGGLSVTAAADQFRGLAILIGSPGVIYPTVAVARSAFEAALQARFLLDGRVDARERVRRHMNTRLVSAREKMWLFDSFADPELEAEGYQRAFDEERRILASAGRQHFATKVPKQRFQAPFLEPRPLGEGELAKELFTADRGRLGPWFWRSMSAVSHSQPHGLVQYLRREVGGVAHTDRVTVGFEVSAQQLAQRLFICVHAIQAMAAAAVVHLGWDPAPMSSPGRTLSAVWGRIAGFAT